MEKVTTAPYSFAIKSYYLLTKPGILMGNAITAAAGFCLASRGDFSLFLFLITVVGLSCVIGSACVFNNYIDRMADQKMERTKDRALAVGSISVKKALGFGCVALLIGVFLLGYFTNILALSAAIFGFIMYVVFYSFSKYYTQYGTLIGSVAGAVPPIVGYCAASNQLDAGGWILFAMLTLWQMPHFYAIAIYRIRDYAAASIPVLPIQKGIYATKVQMLIYTVLFAGVSLLLYSFGYVGKVYLTVSIATSILWLMLSIQGLLPNRSTFTDSRVPAQVLGRLRTISDRDVLWAKKMFRFSLIVITSLSLVMMFGG